MSNPTFKMPGVDEYEREIRRIIVIINDNRGTFEWNKIKKENGNTESQEFREYGVGAQILRDIGVRKMVLMTNSKKAIIGLQGFDLKIVGHKELRNE